MTNSSVQVSLRLGLGLDELIASVDALGKAFDAANAATVNLANRFNSLTDEQKKKFLAWEKRERMYRRRYERRGKSRQ